MPVVGLTGGIGSGKSAVARRLASHGALIIDADRLARQVVEPGTTGLAAVVEAFGPDILTAAGSLDRAALARRVFGDVAARRRLESVIHPLVRQRTADIIAAAPSGSVIVNDVPLLVETGRAAGCDLVIVVLAAQDVRIDRLVRQRGMTVEEARARIAAQATDAQRRAVADIVISNDGTLEALNAEVDRVWTTRLAPLHGASAG
ncbi:MAG TPA: dephospho-CoA kinase [Micromonosporaceae bacterium]|nr:dephospho-CoA kinase [Micromonosporaceae bacterium]